MSQLSTTKGISESFRGFAKDQPVKTAFPGVPSKKGVVVGTDEGDQKITVRIEDGRTFRALPKHLAPILGLAVGVEIQEPTYGRGKILRFKPSSPDKVIVEALMIDGPHANHTLRLDIPLPGASERKQPLDRLTRYLRAEPGSVEETKLKERMSSAKAPSAEEIETRRAENVAAIEARRADRELARIIKENEERLAAQQKTKKRRRGGRKGKRRHTRRHKKRTRGRKKRRKTRRRRRFRRRYDFEAQL